jgi:predicted transcriptional regulator
VVVGVDAGTIVGRGTDKARRYVYFCNKRHPVGNLIILYMTGTLPKFIGYKDGNASNLKFNNIYPSEKRVCIQSENVGVRSRVSDYDLMVKILECMDTGSKTKEELYKANDIPANRFKRLIRELVEANCIVFSSFLEQYSLTSNGHCRVIEECEDRKLMQLLSFYKIMPNFSLPLNHIYGKGLVMT